MTPRFVAMGAVLVLAFALAIALGDQRFTADQIRLALTEPGAGPAYIEKILWDLRLPRASLAVLVGAALAVAGTVSQSIMRNALAEPGILGINAGAALAALLVIVQWQTVSETLLPWLTFAGACVMSAAIYGLAWQQGTTALRIILIGVGLSALAGAGASFISTFGDITSVQRAMVWLAGTLQDSRWAKVEILAIWLLLPVALVWLFARELNLMAIGDDVAKGLGQRVNMTRGLLILATAAISGAAVAAAGLIAFVGLAAPHIARSIVGQRHEALLPAAALCGAIMVVAADIVARRLMPPAQLPVGLMTGLLGAPFFGWLLWKRRND
ncbi:iron ABC transporter permease [Sedimentitalea sp.]|uniref:FecCD family ABC transporter permease n=1 Tax=Sedimentitalea sp. TaxID=2048915 RepID=UPI00329A2A2C